MSTNQAFDCWRMLFSATDEFREKANQEILGGKMIAEITVGQLKVLKAVASLTLDDPSNGIMLKTLAEKVKLTSGAVSIIIDSLVRQGLIERHHSSSDRRAVSIILSENGREKINRYIHFFNRITEEFLAGLSESEQRMMLSLLDRFIEKIRLT